VTEMDLLLAGGSLCFAYVLVALGGMGLVLGMGGYGKGGICLPFLLLWGGFSYDQVQLTRLQ
jgi:hypothetical protein